jgi:hypothetical protein
MADQWFIARGKEKVGPHTSAELKELARTGGLLPIDMVFQEGTQKWRLASEVEGLFWVTVPSATRPTPLAPPLAPSPAQLEGPEKVEKPGTTTPLPPNRPALALTPTRPEEVEAVASPQPPANSPTSGSDTNQTRGPEQVQRPPPWALAFEEAAEAAPPAPNSPPLTPDQEEEPAPSGPALDEAGMATLTPPPASPRQESVEGLAKTAVAIKRSKKLCKRMFAAAGLAALLGLIGDFLQPLVSLNLIGFVATAGLALVLLVLWVKQRITLGKSIGLTCAMLGCLAAGFGGWWALAHFKGGREKGYLADRFRLVARVQSALLTRVEGEQLVDTWVLGSHDPSVAHESEMRFKDGRMTWRVQLPKAGSFIQIEAEYSTTRENIVYGIITRIDYGMTGGKVKANLPEEDDTFSFRFRVDDDLLTVKELKGKGFEELKKYAQGRYRRRGESPAND